MIGKLLDPFGIAFYKELCMPDAKKKTSKVNVLTRDKSEEKRDKKVEALKKSEGLMVCTPVHSEVCLHYMKSCLDLQKECLLNNVNIIRA